MVGPSSVVWMVNTRTGMQGRKGTIHLTDGRLVFEPESRGFGETVFPLSAVRRARRVRGSPVLEVSTDRPDFPQFTGFYFVQPPDLKGREASSIYAFFVRRRAKRDSLNALRTSNVTKKDEIQAWVQAIAEAKRS